MPCPHVKSTFQTNRLIVTMFYLKYEQTGLHICAKRIYDRSSSFKIIHQKACRSYGEHDSSKNVQFNSTLFNFKQYMPVDTTYTYIWIDW
jgi:hypothetical protein